MDSSEHPFLTEGVDIDWRQLVPEKIEADLKAALKSGMEQLDTIRNLSLGDADYAGTFLALENATETVSKPWGFVHVLESLSDSQELREAHRKMLPEVTSYFSKIPLDPDLYGILKAVSETQEAAELDAVRKRFMQETLKDFEEAGASQPEPVRQRLAEIENRLAEVTKTFSDNVLDSTNAWEKIITEESELSGLPASFKEAARLDALSKGHGSEESPVWRFTLQYPSMVPALQFLDSFELKKEIYEGLRSVGHSGGFENEPLIREILELRQEKARILGKSQFADLVLQRRMAGSGSAALGFVENLHERTRSAFEEENANLIRFKAEQTGAEESPLYPWEAAYWTEKLRKQRFDFEEEELRPYFSVHAVLDGLFRMTEDLFGVRVTRRANAQPAWDPAVIVYDLSDAQSGQLLGVFYTDWFPRENKRNGAWMHPIFSGGEFVEGQPNPHLGLIAGNFNKPVGDRPALLTHREVETVFHEFGHLLHHLLSKVPVKSLSGANVAWDFVELPSQIMENWCWERESLDLFARHYETGEPIPEELFNKLLASRTYNAGRFQMRQLSFSKLDLALHLRTEPLNEGELDAVVDTALEGYRDPSPIPHSSIVRAFSHLFSSSVGYAAGYYSYKWAEVLDADAFSRFRKEGILNPDTGRSFRTEILEKGNSEPPEILFRNFMGRDPDPEALMQRLGLS